MPSAGAQFASAPDVSFPPPPAGGLPTIDPSSLTPLAPPAPAGNLGGGMPTQDNFGANLSPNTPLPQLPQIGPAVGSGPDAASFGAPLPANSPAEPQGPANPRTDAVGRLREANNVLVTVSNNPSVDQLAAAIGITLVLNKLNKHATAVFSGAVPSTLEFLQPEKTIEKNTDSLRDFIIALDKSKADKLRYKVEDTFVKIFITPYHTSLSDKDLEFSQGDFNVDVVLALGVQKREDLDQAITAHGRILHDAAVICVNNQKTADIGNVNWLDQEASSLCEMLVGLIEPLQGEQAILDSQIATALLTGLVAETERFSNERTTPHTMNTSALLMKAGANQQLVATKLQEPEPLPKEGEFDGKKLDELAKDKSANVPKARKDGSLQIEHPAQPANQAKTLAELEKANHSVATDDEPESNLDKIHIDESGAFHRLEEMTDDKDAKKEDTSSEQSKPIAEEAAQKAPDGSDEMILQPPTLGGALSANTKPEDEEPAHDPLAGPSSDSKVPDLRDVQHGRSIQPLTDSAKATSSTPTLSDLEKAVDSKHAVEVDQSAQDAAAARQVIDAEATETPKPEAALNATSVELQQPAAPAPADPNTTEEVFPPQLVKPDTGLPPDPTAGSTEATPPPPVPPPLMPPTA